MMTSIHYTSKRILPHTSTYAEMTHFGEYTFSLETHVNV